MADKFNIAMSICLLLVVLLIRVNRCQVGTTTLTDDADLEAEEARAVSWMDFAKPPPPQMQPLRTQVTNETAITMRGRKKKEHQ